MRITELLGRDCILLNAQANDKLDALQQIVKQMMNSGAISDEEAFMTRVLDREEEGTTGTGEGIAIPHGKGSMVNRPALAAMTIPSGVDYNSLDGEPVDLVFLIAAPNTEDNVHLEVLSRLSVMLMDEKFQKNLRQAANVEEFLNVIDRAEQVRLNKENGKEISMAGKIVAVTACPTGIAHTYMAAEALERAASERGCPIKVETRGSGGAKNILSASEIAEADCVIIAADTNVPMERFVGKKVIQVQVSDGISKAASLIDQALSGNVGVYKAGSVSEVNHDDLAGSSIGHQIYTHLMNGISHMLPFVVGGGILIAIAFLLDSFGIDIKSLSVKERGNFGSITEQAALFMTIGKAAFSFMLPVLAGFIAMSIADRPGLAVGFVGGAMAAAGKSGFLGALIAGFIAGYLVILLKRLMKNMPDAIEKLAPVLIYPLLGILFMGLIMTFAIEPPIGALNTLLYDGLNSMGGTSKIVLGIIVAGMMATDMGGPFNKAAYVFGVASIAEGQYYIMAAVMIGGMVPPCAIALSSFLFKNKYTKAEREAGSTTFVMGLAFITEGAIPYAAKDPLRVIPACMIGSGVAGALAMAFNCTLMAPHGGIFVFPVVGNALYYLLALAAGMVVGGVLLGLIKKKVVE